MSEDKDHSHQQVQQFDIVREKLQRPLNNWIRYSDGCGAQFKSGYVVADLFNAPEKFKVKSVSFNFFEFREGKSVSDSIGAIVKCAFIRGILKTQQGVTNIDDILSVIHTKTKPSTKKIDFFIVEKLGWFQKQLPTSGKYCKIEGIMAWHSLKLFEQKVVLRDLTCTECPFDALCKYCESLKQVSQIEYVEMDILSDNDDDDDMDSDCHDDDDDSQTDTSDESEEDEETEFNPGDVIWAKHGRIWYPAQICSLSDVPCHLQHRFPVQKSKLIVKWFGEENYSSVTATQVDVPGENLVDAARASISKFVTEQYNVALGQRLALQI